MIVVHDFAYADIGFDGYRPPSHPAGRRGQGVRRRAVLDDEELLDGRLARAPSWSATPRSSQALVKLKTLPRLRHVPAHPDRGDGHDERGAGLPAGGVRDLPEPARRAVRRPGPHRLGHPEAEGHDVRVGADPRAVPGDGLARVLLACSCEECEVATSPGVGFGPGGEGFVRFALIENEQRIAQGVRNLRKGLTKLVEPATRRRVASRFTMPVTVAVTAHSVPFAAMALLRRCGVWLPDRPGRARARWPAASAPCAATSSASRSSSGAAGGPSTSWSSRCPTPGSSTCSSPRSARSTASTSRTCAPLGGRAATTPRLDALETAARLVEAPDADGAARACCASDAVADFECDWAAVLRPRRRRRCWRDGGAPRRRRGWPPSSTGSQPPRRRRRRATPPRTTWPGPPLRRAGLELVLGRKGRPFRGRERRQLAALARIADAPPGGPPLEPTAVPAVLARPIDAP